MNEKKEMLYEETVNKPFKQLESFHHLVKNAGLFKVPAVELVKYSLRGQSLKPYLTAVKEGKAEKFSKITEMIRKCVKLIANTTSAAIKAFVIEKNLSVTLSCTDAWDIYEKCSEEQLSLTLIDCLTFLAIVYEVRFFPKLLEVAEVENLEVISCAVSHLIAQMDGSIFKQKLPEAVLASFSQTSLMERDVSVFARQEHTLQPEAVVKAEVENAAEFVDDCLKLVENILARKFDTFELERLASKEVLGRIDLGIFVKMCEAVYLVENVADERVINGYMKVLKLVAIACCNWDAVMKYFYEKYRAHMINEWKKWDNYYADYDADLSRLLITISDNLHLYEDEVRMKKAVDEFAWLVLLSPAMSLYAVLMHCLINSEAVPNLIRIIRRLPVFIELEMEAVSSEVNKPQKAPVILLALRHILMKARDEMQAFEHRKQYNYLAAAFCRQRHTIIKSKHRSNDPENNESKSYGEVVDAAIMDGSLLLRFIVLPGSRDPFYRDLAIDLAIKLLTPSGARMTQIQWIDEAACGDVVHLPEQLFLCITSALKKVYGKEEKLVDACFSCLQVLSCRLKEDGYLLDRTFLNELDGLDWTVKLAAMVRLEISDEVHKRPVPSCLYEMIPIGVKSFYDRILPHSNCCQVTYACALHSLFELSVVDVYSSEAILTKGFFSGAVVKMDRGQMIAQTLVDVLNEKMSIQKIIAMFAVVKKLVRLLDVPRTHIRSTIRVSDTFVYAIRLVEPLFILHDAVLIALAPNKENSGIESKHDRVAFLLSEINKKVAMNLLSAFCQLTKMHIQEEMSDLRRSQLYRVAKINEPRIIPSDVEIDRLLRVSVQRTELYLCGVTLAYYLDPTPTDLAALLLEMADYDQELKEMTRMRLINEAVAGKPLNMAVREHTIEEPDVEENSLINEVVPGKPLKMAARKHTIAKSDEEENLTPPVSDLLNNSELTAEKTTNKIAEGDHQLAVERAHSSVFPQRRRKELVKRRNKQWEKNAVIECAADGTAVAATRLIADENLRNTITKSVENRQLLMPSTKTRDLRFTRNSAPYARQDKEQNKNYKKYRGRNNDSRKENIGDAAPIQHARTFYRNSRRK